MIQDAAGDVTTSRAVPSTRGGAEQVLLLLFALHRGVVVVQTVVAFPLLSRDGRVAFVTVVLWSAVAVVAMTRRRQVLPRVAVLDVVVAVAAILVNHIGTGPVGTWSDWSFPIGLSSATLVGAVARSWRWPVLAGGVFGLAYALTSMPQDRTDRYTVLANCLAFLGYALVLRGLSGFLRRLGDAADEARRSAGLAAAEAERERHRRLLHDQKTILEFLGRFGNDATLEAALRRQAARNATRIDRFLHAAHAETAVGEPVLLHDVVVGVAADFDDLPLTVTTYRARGTVATHQATALADAVETVLHNVRRHAQAHEVVVHAESTPDGWRLSVRDDGRGFDVPGTPRGYGLGVLLAEQLPKVGIHVDVASTPGDGTRVELRGVASAPGEP